MLGLAGYTRRWILRLGASLLLNGSAFRLSAFGRSSALKQVAGTISTDAAAWQYREYAVHATVMLGSLPLYSKRNVGGAAVAFEQAKQNESALTALQFIAGSWPDRLHGFNRFGAIREIVREEGKAVTPSAYAGFIATSQEKGLADARKAFASPTQGQVFTVAFGRATATGCTFLMQQLALDAKLCWTDCADLLDGLDTNTTLPPERQVANYGPGCLPTFLFAVHRGSTSSSESPSTYIHNGKVYCLRTQSKMDQTSGHRMITGWTAEVGGRGESEFKLWLAPDDPRSLPVKIEFRARSFLKLTLETGQSTQGRALQPLLRNGEADG
jgi:hypothetical protein